MVCCMLRIIVELLANLTRLVGFSLKQLLLRVRKRKYINGVYKIGGKYYGFDENGRMYNDELCYINDKRYYASKGGAFVLNRAVTVKGSKYYFDASGKGYEGYHSIGGKEYFFIDGKLMTNYAFCLNGNYYVLIQRTEKDH